MTWEAFKLTGPWERDFNGNHVVAWCLFGLRSDGAVFYSAVSIESHHLVNRSFKEAFWMRFTQAMALFDSVLEVEPSAKSYVDFKKAGVCETEDGSLVLK